MIHRLASNITDFFVEKNVVQDSEHEIYIYGFDLMISGLMNVLFVIGTGIALSQLWKALLFVFIMVTVRMYTGGYHADTHVMCNIIFLATFLFSISILELVNSFSVSWCIWLLQCIGLIIVARFAPLENRNKKLNAGQKEKYRTRGVVLYLIFIIVSVTLNIAGSKGTHMQYILLCNSGLYINIVLIIIAGLLMIGIRKERRNYAKEDFKGNC